MTPRRQRLRSLDSAGMSRAYRTRDIFNPYYTLLNQLARGEVDATEDGCPVVQFKGQIEPAGPVLHGFVACWERIARSTRIKANLPALTALAHRLDQDQPIPADELTAARRAMDDCQKAYKRLPLTLVASAANTEEMAAKFVALGLVVADV